MAAAFALDDFVRRRAGPGPGEDVDARTHQVGGSPSGSTLSAFGAQPAISVLKGWPRPTGLEVRRVMCLSVALEKLHGSLVLLGLAARPERPEVAPPAGPGVLAS